MINMNGQTQQVWQKYGLDHQLKILRNRTQQRHCGGQNSKDVVRENRVNLNILWEKKR